MRRHIACFAALLCAPMAYGSQITKDIDTEQPQIMHGPMLAFHSGRGPITEVEQTMGTQNGFLFPSDVEHPNLAPKQNVKLESRDLMDIVSPHVKAVSGFGDRVSDDTQSHVLLAGFYLSAETPDSAGIQKVPVPAAGLLLVSGFSFLGLFGAAHQSAGNATRRRSRFAFGRRHGPKVTSRFTLK